MNLLVPRKEMEKFFDTMNDLDKHSIKMFTDMLWSDIFMAILMIAIISFALYGCWWEWTHQFFIPVLPYFAVYIASWYGTMKTIIDFIGSIQNFLNRRKHYIEAKQRVANYPEEKRKRK